MANIIEITDFMSPELDVYARLTENQLLNRHEPEKGLFIVESPNVVERALNAASRAWTIADGLILGYKLYRKFSGKRKHRSRW